MIDREIIEEVGGYLIALAYVLLLILLFVSRGDAQQQSQGPDETSMSLLGQCVYNNNANATRVVVMQKQIMAMQEQERATAEYWAAWVRGEMEKAAATSNITSGDLTNSSTIKLEPPVTPHHDEEEKPR